MWTNWFLLCLCMYSHNSENWNLLTHLVHQTDRNCYAIMMHYCEKKININTVRAVTPAVVHFKSL